MNQRALLWTSECPPELAAFYRECCCGREDAFLFLLAFHRHAHVVDDLIDEGWTAEGMLGAFAMEQEVSAMPFYRRHEAELRMAWALVRNGYADAVAFERRVAGPERRIADVIRFAGNEMVRAVAFICGGWDHLRVVSPLLWALSWKGHHNESGEGV